MARPDSAAAPSPRLVRGYDWNLSIWQMEVTLTQNFDRPLCGREFFEEIKLDSLIYDAFPFPKAT